MVEDFAKGFRVLKRLQPEVFLASHGNFFVAVIPRAERRGICPSLAVLQRTLEVIGGG